MARMSEILIRHITRKMKSYRIKKTGKISLNALVLISILGLGALVWTVLQRSDLPLSPVAKDSSQPHALAWATPANVHSPSHQRMLEELETIVRKIPDENVWLGDQTARLLREKLKNAPENMPMLDLMGLKSNLAMAELKLGNEKEALRLLTDCETEHFSKFAKGRPLNETVPISNLIRFNLGVVYMRIGETQNCCRQNSPDSCIMPIQGQGIHTNLFGSQNAITCFTAILDSTKGRSQQNLRSQWLLNIAYMTIGGHPQDVPEKYLIPLEEIMPSEPFPRFKNIAGELGLGTYSLSGGAIADDFDNDGNLDLVVSSFDPAGQIKLFHNNGDGSFSDRTEEAGLNGITGGLNLVQADFDNDGWLDILVLRGAWLGESGYHPNSLLRNDGVEGCAQFTDVTFSSGLGDVHLPTQTAAWADFDNDGDLDLYIGNEAGPHAAFDASNQLFRNNGDQTFTDIAESAGLTNDRFTKAVVWGDYNGDRYLDIYVSNFLGENRIYRNNRNGTFSDVARELGVTAPSKSFPAWFWDFDNDGNLDIYASSWAGEIGDLAADSQSLLHEAEMDCLYRGDGEGGFENVAQTMGLTRPTGPMGSNYGDLNGDGFLDFYLGTGEPKFMNLMPNVMFLNHGGERFSNVTRSGGFGHLQKGHAVVFADLDNDGDQDVFEQMGGAYPGDKFYDALYENPGMGNRWITLKLVGVESNRSAIGARIKIDVIEKSSGEQRSIYNWVGSGGSFGANPLRQNIGLGHADLIEKIEIYWPTTDKTQSWSNISPNSSFKVIEGQSDLFEDPAFKK